MPHTKFAKRIFLSPDGKHRIEGDILLSSSFIPRRLFAISLVLLFFPYNNLLFSGAYRLFRCCNLFSSAFTGRAMPSREVTSPFQSFLARRAHRFRSYWTLHATPTLIHARSLLFNPLLHALPSPSFVSQDQSRPRFRHVNILTKIPPSAKNPIVIPF
jgi:hypothetical protein